MLFESRSREGGHAIPWLVNAIPDAGEGDAMTGIRRSSKLEDFKAQFDACGDSERRGGAYSMGRSLQFSR